MKKHLLSAALLPAALLFGASLSAQDWVKMMRDPKANFYDVQKAFSQYYEKAERQMEKQNNQLRKANGSLDGDADQGEVPGLAQYKRWEWFMKPRVSATGERPSPGAVWDAMENYRKQYPIATGTGGAGNWTLIGPTSTSGLSGAGRLNAVYVHPTNANTIFVCAPSGGLWKSTDGGSTWATATDQLPQEIGCSDLAFDPSNANTMYMATGDRDHGDNYSVGLLKSTDGGATWNTTGFSYKMSDYRLIHRVLVDPSNGNNILLATSAGIFRSTNAGVSFTQSASTAAQGEFFDMEYKPGASATVYAAGTTFIKSTDGGATWAAAGTGLTAAASLCRMEMGVTAADPNVVYVIAGKVQPNYGVDGFYKSTNSGANFTAATAPTYGTNSGFGTQEWYDLALAVNPSNAQEVMLGGQIDFLKSTNGGSSWTKIATNSHVDYHNAIYANSTTVYLTSDGGIWKSTDNGSTWTSLNNNLVISQMYGFGQSTTNANILINGWQDNGTNVRGSGGTWSAPLGGDGMLAFVDWNNDQNMWGSQYNGTLYHSVNGGAFSQMTGITGEACPWVTPWNEDPTTANTVYAGCQNIWKSTGGGAFSKLGNVAGTSTVSINAVKVSPASSQVMWASKGTSLYKSTNGGTSWTAITSLPSGTVSDIVCHPTDANKAWVCFSGFSSPNKVFLTTNQGSTWTNISGSLPNIPMNCLQIDKNGKDAIYVGTDAGVFFKDSTMKVWQPFSNGLPNVTVTQLEIFYSGSKIRASTFGRGMWESGLYQPGAYAPSANFAANTQYGCPSSGIQFTDYSTGQPTSWSWTFQGGTPATSTVQNPFVVYNAPGTYSVSLTATNSVTSDTKTYTGYITISASPNAAPTASGKNYCGPATVKLTATPSATGTVRWWSQPAGGTVLGTGNTYTTTSITGTKTYYVDEAFPAGSADAAGEPDNTIGAGGFFTANDLRGLYFNVTKPIVLNSVQVYCNTAGVRTIEILDANGSLVTDTTLNVAATGSVTAGTVTINRTIYPGNNYFIKFRGLVDCYRNNAGATGYPYTSSTGDVTITGTNAGSPGYYYYFYNWAFTEIVCNTARTAVTVNDTCSLTGVSDLFSNNQMEVYPNPNNGEFTLSFNLENSDNYKISITNALGQSVYEEKLDHFSGIYSKKIDITSYQKGVYMINVTNSRNQAVKRVLVY